MTCFYSTECSKDDDYHSRDYVAYVRLSLQQTGAREALQLAPKEQTTTSSTMESTPWKELLAVLFLVLP